MGFDHGAVVFGTCHGDLELARQELEFRVICRPLADQLSDGTGVCDLVSSGTGKVVRSHVADGVTGGLDRMHVHFSQRIKHVRHIAQLRPVVLDVLACGEVAIALVPLVRDICETGHLLTIQGPIGDRNTQHIGMQLQIKTVHQAQGLEFILSQRPINAAFYLRTELSVARGQKVGVKIGVVIHQNCSCLPCA